MAKTDIEWTATVHPDGSVTKGATWNPVRGCSLVSAGCQSCYAMKQAHRFSGEGGAYHGLTKMTSHGPVWTGEARPIESMLEEPLRWRKPRRVFVNSMSDLFHEDVPDSFIDRVFAVMGLAPRHTFQILTKRPRRMREYVADGGRAAGVFDLVRTSELSYRWHGENLPPQSWPLANVWLGVSVEDQATADERIPLLLQTPAAVRFLSCEPLLSSINLSRVPGLNKCGSAGQEITRNLWVIVGGESGPKARPFNIQWARGIIAQCRAAGVPVFVKQLGARPYLHAESSATEERPGFSMRMSSLQIDKTISFIDRAGADPSEWPEDLRVREFPAGAACS